MPSPSPLPADFARAAAPHGGDLQRSAGAVPLGQRWGRWDGGEGGWCLLPGKHRVFVFHSVPVSAQRMEKALLGRI